MDSSVREEQEFMSGCPKITPVLLVLLVHRPTVWQSGESMDGHNDRGGQGERAASGSEE